MFKGTTAFLTTKETCLLKVSNFLLSFSFFGNLHQNQPLN